MEDILRWLLERRVWKQREDRRHRNAEVPNNVNEDVDTCLDCELESHSCASEIFDSLRSQSLREENAINEIRGNHEALKPEGAYLDGQFRVINNRTPRWHQPGHPVARQPGWGFRLDGSRDNHGSPSAPPLDGRRRSRVSAVEQDALRTSGHSSLQPGIHVEDTEHQQPRVVHFAAYPNKRYPPSTKTATKTAGAEARQAPG